MDSDSSDGIDVIPEPDDTASIVSDRLHIVTEASSQPLSVAGPAPVKNGPNDEDSDNETIDLNYRKRPKHPHLTVGTYLSRTGTTKGDSLKPKLDELNSKPQLTAREAKRRRVDNAAKGEPVIDKYKLHKIIHLFKSGHTIATISDQCYVSKQRVQLVIDSTKLAMPTSPPPRLPSSKCIKDTIRKSGKNMKLTVLRADSLPLGKGDLARKGAGSTSRRKIQSANEDKRPSNGGDSAGVTRCQFCQYTLQTGSIEEKQRHSKECLVKVSKTKKLERVVRNLDGEQIDNLDSHFENDRTGKKVCAYCRKELKSCAETSDIVSQALHLELYHDEITWENRRVVIHMVSSGECSPGPSSSRKRSPVPGPSNAGRTIRRIMSNPQPRTLSHEPSATKSSFAGATKQKKLSSSSVSTSSTNDVDDEVFVTAKPNSKGEPDSVKLSARDRDQVDKSEEFVKKQFEFVQEGQLKKQKCNWCGAYFKNAVYTLQTHLRDKCPQFAKRKKRGKDKENSPSASSSSRSRRDHGKEKRRKPTEDEIDDDLEAQLEAEVAGGIETEQKRGEEEKIDKSHNEKIVMIQCIRLLQEKGVLMSFRKCKSCSRPMELASSEEVQDRWVWQCDPCSCKVSLRKDSAISNSDISLDLFDKLYQQYISGATLETVADTLKITQTEVKGIYDKLHMQVADGKTKIKPEISPTKPFIRPASRPATPFQPGVLGLPVKTEPVEGSSDQPFKEDPQGKKCEAHLWEMYGFHNSCSNVALLGKTLCKKHDNKIRMAQTKEELLGPGHRKVEPRMQVNVKCQAPPPVEVKMPVVEQVPPPVEIKMRVVEQAPAPVEPKMRVVKQAPAPAPIPDDEELPAPFDDPVGEDAPIDLEDTNEFSFMSPIHGAEENRDPLEAPTAPPTTPASASRSPDNAPAALSPTFVSVSSQTEADVAADVVTEREKSRDTITSVLFKGFRLADFNVDNWTNIVVDSDAVDEIKERFEDMSVSEYLNTIWQIALNLHNKGIHDILGFLFVVNNFEVRLEAVSQRRQKQSTAELERILSKLDIFTLLVLHRFSLQEQTARSKMQMTSSRLCLMTMVLVLSKRSEKEQQKVFGLLTNSYGTLLVYKLFDLRAVAHSHRNIFTILSCDRILNEKFNEMGYISKVSLADCYFKHIKNLEEEKLWPSLAELQQYDTKSTLRKLVGEVYVDVEVKKTMSTANSILKHCLPYLDASDGPNAGNMTLSTTTFLKCRSCQGLVQKDDLAQHRCGTNEEVSSSSQDVVPIETSAVATQADIQPETSPAATQADIETSAAATQADIEDSPDPYIDDTLLQTDPTLLDIRSPNELLELLADVQSLERENDRFIRRTNVKLECLNLDVRRKTQLKQDLDGRSEKIKLKRDELLNYAAQFRRNLNEEMG